MMHNPGVFERPDEFYPERYLKDGKVDLSVPDGERAAFGFGRRICPGRFFILDTLFVYAASILATFDIAPPLKGEDGHPVPLELKLGEGIVA